MGLKENKKIRKKKRPRGENSKNLAQCFVVSSFLQRRGVVWV